MACGRWATGPTSTHDFFVGKILPGLQSPPGLKASLRRRMNSRSAALKMKGMKSAFSSPIPCSPEIEPPTSAQTFMISAPAATTRASSPGVRGSYRILDRKSTRLNSSHEWISYAVFCLKKKKKTHTRKAAARAGAEEFNGVPIGIED